MLSVSSKVRLFSCAELTPFLGHSDLIVEVKLSVSWNGDGGANAAQRHSGAEANRFYLARRECSPNRANPA
jgi:hypothetical protein